MVIDGCNVVFVKSGGSVCLMVVFYFLTTLSLCGTLMVLEFCAILA